MTTAKLVGIFMDHASARVMELHDKKITTQTISSAFTHQVKNESLTKGENLMHEKEQHQQATYYKALAEVIKDHTHVLIFGPTNAKSELHNSLKKDKHFDAITIEVKSSDKINEAQQEAFVRDYFSTK